MDKKESAPIKAIDFKSLNKTSKNTIAQEPSSSYRYPVLWVIFLLLTVCIFVVFLYLPKLISDKQVSIPVAKKIISPQNTPRIITPKAPVVVPELSIEELNQLKSQAEKLLLQVIKKQELLQGKGVEKWANDEFLQASILATTGDEYFRKQLFPNAIDVYQQAIESLQKIEDKILPTLAKQLEQGEQALSQANRESALFHFEIAKAIDIDNAQANAGLKRASTIEKLFTLLNEGGHLEATNQLEEAKHIYQQALDLDPISLEAKTAMARVSNRLRQIEFSNLISIAYTALENRQYNDARTAFTAAQQLLPNTNEPKQGLAKVALAIRQNKISILSAEAKHFENLEEWEYAKQSYQQILNIDPNHSLAQSGVKRSAIRASTLIRLGEYLDNKDRLYTETVANEAQALLMEANSLNNPGNKILQLSKKLEKILAMARQPITITLLSDNQTDIAIFKVGKFGRFENHKIILKPGKYTVVGSRPGFRDVRKIITVSIDMKDKNILVQCEEPI